MKLRSPLLACVGVGLKLPSPLLACVGVGLKLPSPLWVRNGRFCCSFRAQRCCRFQWSLVEGEQWCCWFQSHHVCASCARNLSPCSAPPAPRRYKTRPARTKRAKKGHFERAGRVLYRARGEKGSTGRILSRARGEKGSAGRILYRQRPGAVLGGEYCLTSAPPAPPVVDLPPPTDTAARPITSLRRSPHRWQWGFGSIRRWLSACRRRVTPLMTPFPPFGGGQAPTGGSVAAKLQTTSAKNAGNGLLWARWSAFWAQQCRTWCVVHM